MGFRAGLYIYIYIPVCLITLCIPGWLPASKKIISETFNSSFGRFLHQLLEKKEDKTTETVAKV